MRNSSRFGRVVVFGVGLIGGSFALALKAAGKVGEVVGFGRTVNALIRAMDLGVIDRVGVNAGQEVAGADLVLLAAPVGGIPEILARIAPYLHDEVVVTDGGSTKANIVSTAREHLGESLGRFVPAHPIAGAENSGVAAARADLFRGKRLVLTPLPENSERTVAKVRLAWEWCGADICELTPERHDRVFAAVSHLPHLLAFALVCELAERENSDEFFGFAAGGFRDFTRIAASHPEMWRDICLSNREAIADELDRYSSRLRDLRSAIERGDGAAIETIFGVARAARRAWAKGPSDGLSTATAI
ncbi:MAG: prephenate dehydrogenase/arogenate dehydrogenase family protein [Candidatus Accumulibacter sp.]|jgi:prephenate dehydrogenase|nr:prephenate dehydrogenase/arogenate dehydrogenase family protein [Accumulibacter sp.]